MRQKELELTVQLLKAGQVVEIAGDFFQAVRVPESYEYRACELCELDCICRGDVAEVCKWMDFPDFDRWYLKLAHP
jgi:hypothetical protein